VDPQPDRLLETPDGTTFRLVEPASANGGRRVVFEIAMSPASPGPPRHVHPEQEESWTVRTGELTLIVGDEERTLRAGESLATPPGTVHTLANRSGAEVVFLDVHEPALDFQEYIEDLDRLTRAGKLGSRRDLRTLVHGATVLVAHRPMQLSASRVQRVAESVLTRVGRLLGCRA
jgi:quercetin dioxygenase-like cupin family protein